MSISINAYPIMPNRPCNFCLSLQGDSVFADFDTDDEGIISLRRISYDGFGCCRVAENSVTKMSQADSRLLREAIARNQLETDQIKEILRRYFQANKNAIWSDALMKHGLL